MISPSVCFDRVQNAMPGMIGRFRRKPKEIAIVRDNDTMLSTRKCKVRLVSVGPEAGFNSCRNVYAMAAQLGRNARSHVFVKMKTDSFTHALAPATAA